MSGTAELIPSQQQKTEDAIAPVSSSPPSSSTSSLHDYALGEKLGEGGNAAVFRATHTASGNVVAVKLIHKKLIADPKFYGRFAREVRAATVLVHDNICRLYAHGETEGELWLAMELIDGGALSALLERHPRLPPQVAAVIADELLAALEVAHEAKILHRDIKPHNVMLTSTGKLKLVDFGIARGEGDAKVTETGFLVGTPAYMSPEQVTGRPIDHRSDLYAAGLVLYEMLLGENPYTRHAPSTALLKIATEPLPAVVDVDAAAVAVLDRVATSLLARDVTKRPQTASAARKQLAAFVGWVKSRHHNVVGEFLHNPIATRDKLLNELFLVESERARALEAKGHKAAAVLAWSRALAFKEDRDARSTCERLCQEGNFSTTTTSERVARAQAEAEAAPGNATLWKRLADIARAEGHLLLAVRGLRRWLADLNDEPAALQLRTLLGEGAGPDVVQGLATRELIGLANLATSSSTQTQAWQTSEQKQQQKQKPLAASPSSATSETTSRPAPLVVVAGGPVDETPSSKPVWLIAAIGGAVLVVVMLAQFTKDATKDAQRTLSENRAQVGQIEENDVERRAQNKLLDARTALAARKANDVVLICNELLSEGALAGAAKREGLWLRGQAYELLSNRQAARRDYLAFLDVAPVTDPHYVDAKAKIEKLGAP